jgi:hypothetical protein
MSEKKGNTGKLRFDFNPSSVLEVQFESDDRWFRVTAEYFRAFDGKRRITRWVKSSPYSQWEARIDEYYGPIYMWGTNTLVEKENKGGLVSSKKYELFLENSKNRNQYQNR